MSVLDLWLPIILAAVAVFIASFLAWVVLPHHKSEYKGLENENALFEIIRSAPPGQYMFPYCGDTKNAHKDPEFMAKYKAGPHGWLTRWPGPPNMGANMAKSFLVYLFAALLVGYVGALAVPAGTRFVEVLRVTFTVGMACFCIGFLPNAIWFGKPRRAIVTDVIDGLAYAGVMGVIFAAMWPGAE